MSRSVCSSAHIFHRVLYCAVLAGLHAGFVILQETEITALCVAAREGHHEVVILLLKHGSKVNHQVITVIYLSSVLCLRHCLLADGAVVCFIFNVQCAHI